MHGPLQISNDRKNQSIPDLFDSGKPKRPLRLPQATSDFGGPSVDYWLSAKLVRGVSKVNCMQIGPVIRQRLIVFHQRIRQLLASRTRSVAFVGLLTTIVFSDPVNLAYASNGGNKDAADRQAKFFYLAGKFDEARAIWQRRSDECDHNAVLNLGALQRNVVSGNDSIAVALPHFIAAAQMGNRFATRYAMDAAKGMTSEQILSAREIGAALYPHCPRFQAQETREPSLR